MRRPLVLVAASGLVREVLAGPPMAGFEVRGVLDDAPNLLGSAVGGTRVLGGVDQVGEHADAQLLVCAGRGESRRALVGRLAALGVVDDRYATVVHPTAVVGHGCTVGPGSILLAHAVLTGDVTLGRHVVAMPQVTLTHDDRVDDFATLCAGVSLGGSVHVGEAAYLGMNSSVREHTGVGAGSVLGMGAVLLRDLPAGETWVGVPAGRRGRRPASGFVQNNLEHGSVA